MEKTETGIETITLQHLAKKELFKALHELLDELEFNGLRVIHTSTFTDPINQNHIASVHYQL